MSNSAPPHTPYNLDALLQTDMNTPISPSIIQQILSKPPFIPIPGAVNMRDLGLLPSSPIPPGLIYRSGATHHIDPTELKSLGVKMIVDLRSEREVLRDADPRIEGIQNVWIEGTKAPSRINLATFIQGESAKAYAELNSEVLEIYAPSIKKALEWIRDGMGPMLVHCTAGKDRTGVVSAIILSLAGAPRSLIAYDYVLTRVGIEPNREPLLQMLKLWNKEWTQETPGMSEYIQTKGEFILALFDVVDRKYGSVEGYVRDFLGFNGEDIISIKRLLGGHLSNEN
ncbi:protein-tyrosine phosphatase-like protein [Phaeosphaeriaceae sp. PMI808]|nr:protein-tyrosine phosphatase-like protein [Phaeosphaeriaceae sp. PMI808]